MERIPAHRFAEAARAAGQGPGGVLRIVLLRTVVGTVLVAWLVLRGYRRRDDEGPAAG